MRVKHDLRHEMGIVTAHTQALWKALLALPETVEGMQEALDGMTMTERRQLADFCGILAQRSFQIHERSRWLRQQLTHEG